MLHKQKSHHSIFKFLQLIDSLLKFSFAFIYHQLSLNKKKVCLIGSNYGEKRSDNAVALFEYIRHQTCNEAYFVENTSKGGCSIKRGSLKCFLYFFQSEGIFFSHSLSDILPHMQHITFLYKYWEDPPIVFIQHGVMAGTGLKTVDRYFKKNASIANYVVVSSKIEQALLMRLGINEGKITITGLPIHDHAAFLQKKKKILIFFTWRKNTVDGQKTEAILNSSEVLGVIKKHKYDLIVHHHDMDGQQNYYIKADGLKRIDDRPLKEAINQAEFLITDNSSVAWEFFYRKRDVFFYRPSPNTRVDLRKEGFHVAENLSELSNLLDLAFKKTLPPTNTKGFFAYDDKKNCERVYNLIFGGSRKIV